VLVVDNLCTDNTVAVVEEHIRRGTVPGLRIVCEPQLGLTNARLCGVRNTSAPWIGYVDDDCLLQHDWVEQAVGFLREHPECGALGGKVVLDWEVAPPEYFLKFEYSYAAQNHGDEPTQVGCLAGAGMIVNRQALDKSGWLHRRWMTDRVGKRLVSGGDVELALRIRSAGYPLWYYPGCSLMHVIPARRISAPYITRMNYGLGISQTFADAMVWPASFNSWLITTVVQAVRTSGELLVAAAKALIKGRRRGEVVVSTSFVCGRWVGIGAMLHTRYRRTLLGCAKSTQQ
jgi:glycosyltransferase involved in cell wall biosynthesis